jgi:hypothetical protein
VRKKSEFWGLGVLLLPGAWQVSLLMKCFLRTSLLVELGVTGANVLTAILVWGMILAGLIFTVKGLRLFILQQRAKRIEIARHKSALENQEKSLRLEVVRKHVIQVQDERPKLRLDMEKCLEQIDRVGDQ